MEARGRFEERGVVEGGARALGDEVGRELRDEDRDLGAGEELEGGDGVAGGAGPGGEREEEVLGGVGVEEGGRGFDEARGVVAEAGGVDDEGGTDAGGAELGEGLAVGVFPLGLGHLVPEPTSDFDEERVLLAGDDGERVGGGPEVEERGQAAEVALAVVQFDDGQEAGGARGVEGAVERGGRRGADPDDADGVGAGLGDLLEFGESVLPAAPGDHFVDSPQHDGVATTVPQLAIADLKGGGPERFEALRGAQIGLATPAKDCGRDEQAREGVDSHDSGVIAQTFFEPTSKLLATVPVMTAPAARSSFAVVRAFPYERMSDADLVRHVAQGDEAALSAVWYRYSGQVRRTLHGCMGADPAVDDLLQEVFLAFSRRAATVTEPARLRSYLIGSALRQARHRLRTRRRRNFWLKLWATSHVDDVELPPVAPRDALRALQAIVASLPERLRETFVLADVEGLAPAEIAEIRAVSLATVKRDAARARARVLTRAEREPALAQYIEGMVRGQPGSDQDGSAHEH